MNIILESFTYWAGLIAYQHIGCNYVNIQSMTPRNFFKQVILKNTARKLKINFIHGRKIILYHKKQVIHDQEAKQLIAAECKI